MSNFKRRVTRNGKRVAIVGDAPGGNYEQSAIDLAMEAAGVWRVDVDVRHDEWCALLSRLGPCNCNPHVSARGEGK